ncbi:hypothetical protein O181_051853 [Austropuccinia psidii MF-1]|uniref:Uncharacterized protein n=1 Tax=Austropuccinia psidii MF-1 TaxID=1389203 RepID=A0A9Q3HNS5_9BASI|nr:hypothetical protein [Austropuccinia psidii MF-1]
MSALKLPADDPQSAIDFKSKPLFLPQLHYPARLSPIISRSAVGGEPGLMIVIGRKKRNHRSNKTESIDIHRFSRHLFIGFLPEENNSFLAQSTSSTQQPIMSFRATFKRFWYEPAAVPLYVLMAGSMSGVGWYLFRLAKGPNVIWDRHNNPEPWNDVQPGQNTKMMAVNQEFPNGSYKRSKF